MTPNGIAAAQDRRNLVVVEVADLKVSDRPGEILVTYALGSCIAVCVHDPVHRVAGMIHYMLPLSKHSPDKAESKPAMFADTGIPLLFNEMFAAGSQKDDLVVKLVGGGNIHDTNGTFQIGKRNHTLAKKLLWKNGILIAAEEVGGQKSRTVRLFVDDGRVVISSAGQEEEL